MKLFIDAGNSRCKWLICTSDAAHQIYGAVLNCELKASLSATIAEAVGRIGDDALQEVWVSSVAARDVSWYLSDWVREAYNVSPKYAVVQAQCVGLKVAYNNIENLGVDRWLAMLAAHAYGKGPYCVVDAGTAVTVDCVSGLGQHLGGLIAPGAAALADALHAPIKNRSRQVPDWESPWHFACDTAPCIDNGLVAMMHGFAAQVIAKCKALSITNVYLAGGDGEKLYPCFDAAVTHSAAGIKLYRRPHLVLDGLQLLADPKICLPLV